MYAVSVTSYSVVPLIVLAVRVNHHRIFSLKCLNISIVSTSNITSTFLWSDPWLSQKSKIGNIFNCLLGRRPPARPVRVTGWPAYRSNCLPLLAISSRRCSIQGRRVKIIIPLVLMSRVKITLIGLPSRPIKT